MKKATIKDVAREAGVSVATASNALNNPSIVRPRTREAILEAARRLSYVPNANGRRLRAKETRTIGLFVHVMLGDFYGSLADSMNQVCRANGYELHICIVSDMESIYRKLMDHSLDGAVIYWDDVDEESGRKMIACDCPLVVLSLDLHGPRTSCIRFESLKQGRMAAEYLYGLGMRKFLHMFGLPGNYDSEKRCEGFLQVLEDRGIPCDDVTLLEGRFERAVAYREMRRYLHEGRPLPDAVFAANDLSAIGCIAALNEMGWRVPEDVSVMGCDDIALCEYFTPQLTTIRTHFQEIGTRAAREVLRLIQGEPGRLLTQDGVLVVRKSCAISQKKNGKP